MPVTPLDPSDPQHLGEFVLTGRLGAGGMGVVYLGRAADGSLVAVKLVRADLAHDPTFRERFRREVEALRRVSGPRVARLVAADTEAPQPYLVVEYVDGPTLADSVSANGPLAGDRLRALAAALAEALVLIHEAGVIHRDLKPSNVILAADQPMLVDFGIAAAAGAVPLTMAGTIIGSAGWMAPEQAAGRVSTPAVDVFTWASLVAYAGTGRPPFGTGGPEEVTSRILNGEPDLLGLPQDVRPFIEAAFIKDPARRPSARDVLAGLVGAQDGDSTDELVEETTHLIENTWVMPVGGWRAAADRTPVHPPPPPPVAPLAAPPPAPPTPRRLWPVVLVVALLCLALGAVAALLVTGDDPNQSTAATSTAGSPAPSSPPATTAPPTTTTTTEPPPTTVAPPAPLDVTVELTNIRNDLTDVLGEADPCTETASVTITSDAGDVLGGPVDFPAGEALDGTGDLADCLYTVGLPGVVLADRNQVTITDNAGDFDPVAFSRDEIEAAGGVIEVEVDGLAAL